MTAVLKHELRAYFHSLTAYVFGAFLLAFVGICPHTRFAGQKNNLYNGKG